MSAFIPGYFALYESGRLEEKCREAWELLSSCSLCPHLCGVNRLEGQTGRCRSGILPGVSSFNAHFGEEPPLVGHGGSGTIFLTGCTLRCAFCQNFPISQQGVGREYTIEQLAGMFLNLQKRGCENINFVTPTHFMPQILKALLLAIPAGFRLPLVYNTSGYERVEIIRMLEGVIDIYLPDIKYSDDAMAEKYSCAPRYTENNRAAILEMFRQVGNLECDSRGVGRRGLIVRHLVLPDGLAGTEESLRWLAKHISTDLHVALMSQYFPAHTALEIPELSRRVTREEYAPLARLHEELGLDGWIQPI